MEKGYKFRIYPTKEQIVLIMKTFGCVRFVYNQTLAEKIRTYETEKRQLTRFDCVKMLPELKAIYPWLKEVDATALQASVEDMDRAFQNFFRACKGQGNKGFPKFKSRKSNRMSYTAKMNMAVRDGAVRLPKLGWVKARISKPVEGRILRGTVTMTRSGKFFVGLCCTDIKIPQYPSTGEITGIDLGFKSLVTTSDGDVFDNPKYMQKVERKRARFHRSLSRKSRDSKNYERARLRLARLEERITNQRTDYLHKLTTHLVQQYDVICMEHLDVLGMTYNQLRAKGVADSGLGTIRRMLRYKMEWQHKDLIEINQFFPSSQIYSCCGRQNRALRDTRIRAWTCPHCGAYHDRDINAAQNLLNEGLRELQIGA